MADQGAPATVHVEKRSGDPKRLLLIGGGGLYLSYIVWSVFLMGFLPRPSGTMQWLVSLGMFIALLFGVLLLAIGAFALLRIRSAENIDEDVQKKALIKIGIGIGPGLLLSVITPLMILREPVLPIVIESPVLTEDFVAPVAVTFNLQRSADILARYGLQAIQYEWDFEGDQKVNQRTLLPSATAVYDREGIYNVTAKILLGNGNRRKAVYRLVIQRAAVALTPPAPIREKAVVFSLAHLVDDPQQIVQITWDFESDGNIDDTTKTPETTYTYYRNGRYTVTAVMRMQNKTQARYQRSFEVQDPPKLPFPVTIVTEPHRLISPPPFSVLFRVETEEPIAQVDWSFGDRAKEEGLRVAHTYEQVGTYPVVTKIRSKSGALAELVNVVRVGEELPLPDLTFEGSHPVEQGKIEGESPLKLMLTAKSPLRNVEYEWEVPDATEVASTKTKLQALYRRPGTYTVVLVAEDAEHRATRIPIKVIVHPPSSIIDFRMDREGGVAPLTVAFDASIANIPGEEITGFEWSFGDEGTTGAFAPRPAYTTHRYEKPGTYEITLRVRTISGNNEATRQKTLVVRESVLRACAMPSRLSGTAPLQVAFDGRCSTGTAIYEWNFGDGTESTGETFIHTFEEPGEYKVTLTVRDAGKRENVWTTTISAQKP
ncbi:PKD domain-containing protein [Candidatus Peregrinibacteria bacterium]|nr:PKD domain-containing protein [Candidatus Peregrinibacteria bacterium]